MSVTRQDIQYIANLAKLSVSDKEAENLEKDLNTILGYMEQLNKVDTQNVEPLEHVLDLAPVLRKDEPQSPLSHEEAMSNAPDADSDYFRVPKVIE